MTKGDDQNARTTQSSGSIGRHDHMRRVGVRRVRHLAAAFESDHRLGRGRARGSDHPDTVHSWADQEAEVVS